MGDINYDKAQYPVPRRYSLAHRRYWKRLATPGSWLTGAERIAVAKEVRQVANCKLCADRKTALSPYQVDGAHDTTSDLPDTVVEVVHRVTSDPGRLTKSWFDGIMQQDLSVECYVEVIGTLGSVLCIDEFCRGLDISLNELPEPAAGEPDHYRPANIREDSDDAWVPMLPNVACSGPEADLWEDRMGNIVRALSLVPNEVRDMFNLGEAHYLDPEDVWNLTGSPHGTLTRRQMEIVAARVSALNGCFY